MFMDFVGVLLGIYRFCERFRTLVSLKSFRERERGGGLWIFRTLRSDKFLH
ncbi:hypothetical protein LguiA_005618 [Lonicera macranthoides]